MLRQKAISRGILPKSVEIAYKNWKSFWLGVEIAYKKLKGLWLGVEIAYKNWKGFGSV